MSRVLVGSAVALAGLSFLIPAALPAGSGWEIVRAAKMMLGVADTDRPGAKGWGEGYIPNVPVVNQDGKTFRFFDDMIKDKVFLISFIYTSCPDICPLTTARMAQVQERLGDAVGRDIFIYSISIDPENDTPDVLKQYSAAFNAGPGWEFLTGSKENIEIIRSRLGDRLEDLNDHTQEVRLGNGATGEWRRAGLLGDIEVLLESIRQLNVEHRSQRRTIAFNPASNTGIEFKEDIGRQTFLRACAPCHTVGVGDRVGPDLHGVADRRDRDWLESIIMRPDQLRREQDPIAVALGAQYPGVDMPNLGLGPIDVDEVIDYIERETARLNKMEAEHRANHDHSSHDHGAHEHGGADHSHGGHDHGDPNASHDHPHPDHNDASHSHQGASNHAH